MSISESIQRAKQTLFNNLQVRRYYGKKYYRQTKNGTGGGTQARHTPYKTGASQSGLSKSAARAIQSQKVQIINDKLSASMTTVKG